jgi:hypothetical protein
LVFHQLCNGVRVGLQWCQNGVRMM